MTDKKSSKDSTPGELRLGVMIESLDSKFDLLLEGFDTLNHKANDADKKIDELNTKVEGNSRDIVDLRTEMRSGFDSIMQYLSRIDDEIQDLKKTLSTKADLSRLEKLEREVASIKLAIHKKGLI